MPSPADLPDPGIESGSLALQVDSLQADLSGKPFPLFTSHFLFGNLQFDSFWPYFYFVVCLLICRSSLYSVALCHFFCIFFHSLVF